MINNTTPHCGLREAISRVSLLIIAMSCSVDWSVQLLNVHYNRMVNEPRAMKGRGEVMEMLNGSACQVGQNTVQPHSRLRYKNCLFTITVILTYV